MINSKSKHLGVGLIEVLVAVVILSLGFLASAKMQVTGMQYSQSAYFLSQGNFMLRDMTDRMRTNRTGVINGDYSPFLTVGTTTEPLCISDKTKCTSAEIAQADLHAWSQYLHAPTNSVEFKPLLPSFETMPAQGEITYEALTDVYSVSVRWGQHIDGTLEEQILNVRLTP